jgi:hypothetical protein
LLQDAAHETTGIDRTIFKSHRHGVPVNSSHEETEQTSDGKEFLEGITVYRSHLQEAKNDHIDDHWPFTSESVSKKTKDGGAYRAQEEGECDGSRDIRVCRVEAGRCQFRREIEWRQDKTYYFANFVVWIDKA